MNAKLNHLTNGLAVVASTVRSTGICTSDTNADGYLTTDGTNRQVLHGITTDGTHQLWIATNGGPLLLADNIDDDLLTLHGLGDYEGQSHGPERELEQVREGCRRMIEAAEDTRELYKGNEEAAEQLEWFADRARDVLALIDSDEERALSILSDAGVDTK